MDYDKSQQTEQKQYRDPKHWLYCNRFKVMDGFNNWLNFTKITLVDGFNTIFIITGLL